MRVYYFSGNAGVRCDYYFLHGDLWLRAACTKSLMRRSSAGMWDDMNKILEVKHTTKEYEMGKNNRQRVLYAISGMGSAIQGSHSALRHSSRPVWMPADGKEAAKALQKLALGAWAGAERVQAKGREADGQGAMFVTL